MLLWVSRLLLKTTRPLQLHWTALKGQRLVETISKLVHTWLYFALHLEQNELGKLSIKSTVRA